MYVFIDESGNHTRRDCYVVAGCWCVSDESDLGRVLRPTKNRISDNVVFDGDGPSPGRELKGARLSESKLDSTFAYMRNILRMDGTINSRDAPWNDFPIAYTVYDSDSDVGRGITERHLGEGRSQMSSQLIGLASITSPILRLGEQIAPSIDSYQIVLDAATWDRPSARLESIVGSLGWAPSVSFETRDSERVPGIQLADIAAYSRRKRLRDGSCSEAMRYLHRLLL